MDPVARLPPLKRAPGLGTLALMVGAALLLWAALFAPTYHYSFFWDDLHQVRPYSRAELASTLLGRSDPDQLETVALRPLAVLVFCAQGALLGENLLAQRLAMTALMGALLLVVGLLLRELGLRTAHVAVVLALFVSSRVFASLILWITLGTLLVCYLFYVLAALLFLRWLERPRAVLLLAVLACAAVSVFTREEAYALPVLLVILGWGRPRGRVLGGAAAVLAVMAVHFALRRAYLPTAPVPGLTAGAAARVGRSLAASWMPGGLSFTGGVDQALSGLWIAALAVVVGVFLASAPSPARRAFARACACGTLLCAPALAIARPFGIALPTLAFLTAFAIAAVHLGERARSARATPALVALTIAVGLGGGLRRSLDVADGLHDNCATKVMRDGTFVLDPKLARSTIPAARKEALLARLALLGIDGDEDLVRLWTMVEEEPATFRANDRHSLDRLLERKRHVPRALFKKALFLPRYDYMSF